VPKAFNQTSSKRLLSAANSLASALALASGRSVTRQIALLRKLRNFRADAAVTDKERNSFETRSAWLTTTLDHMDLGLMIVDAASVISFCNRRAIELLDLPAGMMDARPTAADVIEFLSNRDEFADPQQTPFDTALLLDDQASYERRRPDGTVLEIRTTPLPGGGMIRTYSDITARATAEVMLSLAASHDQLTGLANRNGFNLRLDAALATAQRSDATLAVLCLDLDRFKAVNDTLGHHAGDQLLIQVAQRMRDAARAMDVIGRLGGDEFAIVLPGANLAGAEQVSERLLAAIREPYTLKGRTIGVGISIGVAIYPTDGAIAEELLRNADTALYSAKAGGRNTWRAFAGEDGAREHQRVELEQEFRAAVEAHQFNLVYQPICDGSTREPVAFEALLRWDHATRGEVSPAEFIPMAERTGLIVPLGQWVIEAACAEAAVWAMPLRVAVNLSPAQFRDRGLPEFIEDVLSRTSLSPNRLDLEVTEGLLLEDVDNVIRTMHALRAMGIRVVLDDFGTAQSNLSYLRGFPFDAVKIDRSFLRALKSDRHARALVEAMLTMARALGLDVIGEGVETEEQLDLLNHLRCRWMQGYLLGRPASNQEARDWIWKLASRNTKGERSVHPARHALGGS
jgi:diguanylate cyclase